MNAPEREQRLIFAEVAREYDRFRPSYPDALFDTIVEFGDLRADDPALEIGAGTGKASVGFLARGLRVLALEPTTGMAAIARAKGVEVEESLFETWDPAGRRFRLAYAAQAWHWVTGDDRYDRAATALSPGATFALFWNKGREWTGPLGDDNDAAYDTYAPRMSGGSTWNLDWVLEGIDACPQFEAPERRVVTWTCTYTRDEWVELLGTHSDHRILPEAQREQLHAAVGEVIDRHGGRVDVVYDTECYLSRRV
jgi:SAM-dependent methyltransferase